MTEITQEEEQKTKDRRQSDETKEVKARDIKQKRTRDKKEGKEEAIGNKQNNNAAARDIIETTKGKEKCI
ncbi:21523_t:CDS:2 [Rhizophagus irregularis]|nr:21523_t:CDS:2 [Rhizophagus irregularis]